MYVVDFFPQLAFGHQPTNMFSEIIISIMIIHMY